MLTAILSRTAPELSALWLPQSNRVAFRISEPGEGTRGYIDRWDQYLHAKRFNSIQGCLYIIYFHVEDCVIKARARVPLCAQLSPRRT